MSVMEERPLKTALKAGWQSKCPRCQGGHVYDSYLKLRKECRLCGEDLSHQQADDLPAWITIMVTGHIIGPIVFAVHDIFIIPLWLSWAIWPPLTLAMVLILLPRFKAMVLALQWARRWGGFGARKTRPAIDALRDAPLEPNS